MPSDLSPPPPTEAEREELAHTFPEYATLARTVRYLLHRDQQDEVCEEWGCRLLPAHKPGSHPPIPDGWDAERWDQPDSEDDWLGDDGLAYTRGIGDAPPDGPRVIIRRSTWAYGAAGGEGTPVLRSAAANEGPGGGPLTSQEGEEAAAHAVYAPAAAHTSTEWKQYLTVLYAALARERAAHAALRTGVQAVVDAMTSGPAHTHSPFAARLARLLDPPDPT